MDNIVTIRDLKKYYDNGATKALNGINLDIRRGEFVSIIGPSGSGKSTLLNMIGALDVPDSGSIKVDGIDLTDNKENLSKFRKDKIGFIFQLHNLIPNLSVKENVQIPLLGQGIRVNRKREEKSIELLKSVGLEDKINQNPSKMSGGQRQRVAIARALVNEPSIIIADEPTGALDTKTSSKIMNLLKQLHKESNVTLIVVTHDPTVASQAERIITVRDGQIIETQDNDENNNSNMQSPQNTIVDDEISVSDIDFVDYITDSNNMIGTDIQKRVQVTMDNKRMLLDIKALTSSQIRNARINDEKGIATFQEYIVYQGAYSINGGQIPLETIQEKLPAGVVDKLSERIIKYSLYSQ